MAVAYEAAVACGPRIGLGWIWAVVVLLHVVFFLAPPLLSSDIFNYVGYARLDAVHHLNPYIHPLSAAPTDPSYIYVGWPLNTTAYGPLFTLGSLPLGWVNFTAAIWLLKGSAAVILKGFDIPMSERAAVHSPEELKLIATAARRRVSA